MAERKIEQAVKIDPHTGFVSETPGAAPQQRTEAGSLNQVREILLGPLSDNFEQRLSNLETKVDQSIGNLTQQNAKRIEALENQIRRELQGIQETLVKRVDKNTGDHEQLKKDVQIGVQELQGTVKKVSDGLSSAYDNIHNELKREIDGIVGQLEQMSNTMSNRLHGESTRLRGELVDRTSLASALSDVVARLSAVPEVAAPPAPSPTMGGAKAVPASNTHGSKAAAGCDVDDDLDRILDAKTGGAKVKK